MDPANSLAKRVTIAQSTSMGGSGGRYGDYFAAAPDPANSTLVWTAGEYVLPTVYGTFIASERFTAPYFTVTPARDFLYIRIGTHATDNITLGSYAFAGTVSMSATVSPSGQHITNTFNPSSLTLTPNGSGISTLTVSTTGQTQIGHYNVTVTGTSGSLSHSTIIDVCVHVKPIYC